MLPAWAYLVVAFAWLVAFRVHRKKAATRLNASIGAGAVRDLTGRGGF